MTQIFTKRSKEKNTKGKENLLDLLGKVSRFYSPLLQVRIGVYELDHRQGHRLHNELNRLLITPVEHDVWRKDPKRDALASLEEGQKRMQICEEKTETYFGKNKAEKPEIVAMQKAFSNFNGFLAPVFTCFEDNEIKSLNLEYIEVYALWLKSKGAKGVMVHGITGEGPTLCKAERQLHAEAWSKACEKYELIMLLQIGGAPLADVINLARHASTLHLHGVVCIPELFYKPSDVDQLVGYCKLIAKNCSNHPFLYYHLPHYTNMYFDMSEFCQLAENRIPNFVGLEYSHCDLDMALKCLSSNRVIILSDSRLLSNGLFLGFNSFCMAAFNIVPDLMKDIYTAMHNGNLKKANKGQKRLNGLIRDHTDKLKKENWVKGMKNWFNTEMLATDGAAFTAGHARKLY